MNTPNRQQKRNLVLSISKQQKQNAKQIDKLRNENAKLVQRLQAQNSQRRKGYKGNFIQKGILLLKTMLLRKP
jgi:hypothetical protein